MDAKEFVGNWNALRGELLETFMAADGGGAVAAKVRGLGLSAAQAGVRENLNVQKLLGSEATRIAVSKTLNVLKKWMVLLRIVNRRG